MEPCDVPLHIRLVHTHKEELNTQPAKAFYPSPLSYFGDSLVTTVGASVKPVDYSEEDKAGS